MNTSTNTYTIQANSCEDADQKRASLIKAIWKKYVENFTKAQTEEEKIDIVRQAIRRGYITYNLNDSDEKAIYNEMKQSSSPRKVAHHDQVIVSDSQISLQKN